jgi:hypothetical protein
MYARIANNEIAELDSADHNGESGWVSVSDSDVGQTLKYDTDTSAVRGKTEAEEEADYNAARLIDSWSTLRNVRNGFLDDTDKYAVNDRAATPNMPEYRTYLRDLPATYDDTSVLGAHVVMTFDEYVASL